MLTLLPLGDWFVLVLELVCFSHLFKDFFIRLMPKYLLWKPQFQICSGLLRKILKNLYQISLINLCKHAMRHCFSLTVSVLMIFFAG